MLRYLAILSLAAVVWGCGDPAASAPPEVGPAAPAVVVCPVEGTRFPAGAGVAVDLGRGAPVEVCSEGCAIRIRELPPPENQGR